MGSSIIQIYMAFVVDLEKTMPTRFPAPGEPGSNLDVLSMRWIGTNRLLIQEATKRPTEDDRTIGLTEYEWTLSDGKWRRSAS